MIIDGDAHFGDGTEDCLDTLKLRQRVINVTRDEIGCTDQSRFTASNWETFTDQLIAKHKPDVLLYQAGADAWDEDPYGAGYLSKRHMGFRDSGIFRSAKKHLIPIAWNLAGGYSEPMQKTIDLHLQTLKISDQTFEGVK
jgi:acetoin utilization deacetylase AcuC-like enzyme